MKTPVLACLVLLSSFVCLSVVINLDWKPTGCCVFTAWPPPCLQHEIVIVPSRCFTTHKLALPVVTSCQLLPGRSRRCRGEVSLTSGSTSKQNKTCPYTPTSLLEFVEFLLTPLGRSSGKASTRTRVRVCVCSPRHKSIGFKYQK